MATNSTDGLWTLGFGEVAATLKGMQDAGITSEILARFRSNKATDKQWAEKMARLMLGNEQIAYSLPAPDRMVLLELLRTADGAAQEAFKANDFFKENDQPDGIKFWLGGNFKKHFLKGIGKIELDVPAATLNVYKLRENSVDGPILGALGGNDVAKTSLAYMAQLIKAQPQGQEGVLLTNGWANIFYIEDDNGGLWAVDCYWRSDGREWNVEACPVAYPYRWLAGRQVVSPAVLVS
jgi:hypothetical protein